MRGKKHCVTCKKRFRPDPRVGTRQKCCGDPACSRAQHLATKAALYQRDKQAIADERLALGLVSQIASRLPVVAEPADESGVSQPSASPSPTIAPGHVVSVGYAQVRWPAVSSAMGHKSAVVLKALAEVARAAVSSEIGLKLRVAVEAYAKVGQRRLSSQFVRARSSA